MHNAGVVVRRAGEIVRVAAEARLHVPAAQQEGGAGEGGAQPRHDGAVDGVVAPLDEERPRVAAPDVGDGRPGVAPVVAVAVQRVARDAACVSMVRSSAAYLEKTRAM